MLLVARIATSLLVMVASSAGLLALPKPCEDGVTMSRSAESGCGAACACCPGSCACSVSPKAPAPESSPPAVVTPTVGPTAFRDLGFVAIHPVTRVVGDVLPALRPLDRFAPTAGPGRADRTLELFCTLLV